MGKLERKEGGLFLHLSQLLDFFLVAQNRVGEAREHVTDSGLTLKSVDMIWSLSNYLLCLNLKRC
jgi:hypothetical protein